MGARLAIVLALALASCSFSQHALAGAPSWAGRYTVGSGDSLTTIAEHYEVSLQALAQANKLDWRAQLLIGDVLHVPASHRATLPAWKGRYRVGSGDSLTTIAERFGVSLQALAAANALDPRAPLLAGAVLHVPAHRAVRAPARRAVRVPAWRGRLTVAAGDTLGGIAARVGVSLAALAAVNGLDARAPLVVGAVLHVPLPVSRALAAPAWRGRLTVAAGDTLGGIAARVGVSVRALAAANRLDTASPLLAGAVLHVPLRRAVAAPAWSGRAAVAVGDTLSGLAQRFGVSVQRLAAANGLVPGSALLAGAVLRVPLQRAAAAPAWSGRAAVAVGDTLSGLALRYGVSVQRLAAANGLAPGAPLLAGAVLRVPAGRTVATPAWAGTYVVEAGDTLSGIALRFNVSLAQLASANGINPAGVLLSGARLRVPFGASIDLSRVVESDVYSPGAIGYDVSYPNCAVPLPGGLSFGLVGVNGGRPFTVNPCFASEWAAAQPPRSVYINSAYSPKLFHWITPACASLGASQTLAPEAQRAYALGCSEASAALVQLADSPPLAIWVDVEPANTWSSERDLNAATIKGLLGQLLSQEPHPLIGVYSNGVIWRQIVGDWTSLSVPEWIATGAAVPPGCPSGFADGPVWLSQGDTGVLDVDTAC